jgi:transposase
MVADRVDHVVGVDTHRDEHVLAVVAAPSGVVVGQRSVTATARGYAEAVRFADEHAPAGRVWAVEGAGLYGAGLARHLSGRGEAVLEAARSPRGERRLRAKDDQLDAIRAARAVRREDTRARRTSSVRVR